MCAVHVMARGMACWRARRADCHGRTDARNATCNACGGGAAAAERARGLPLAAGVAAPTLPYLTYLTLRITFTLPYLTLPYLTLPQEWQHGVQLGGEGDVEMISLSELAAYELV